VVKHRRVTGRPAEGFPPARGRTRWDFSAVADGHVYLLRKGEDFDVEVESLAVAARRWAREHDYTLATRSEFDEDDPQRPKVALYLRFDRPA
jgi:hypothetical protein